MIKTEYLRELHQAPDGIWENSQKVVVHSTADRESRNITTMNYTFASTVDTVFPNKNFMVYVLQVNFFNTNDTSECIEEANNLKTAITNSTLGQVAEFGITETDTPTTLLIGTKNMDELVTQISGKPDIFGEKFSLAARELSTKIWPEFKKKTRDLIPSDPSRG